MPKGADIMVLEQVEIVERNGLKVVVKRFSDIQGLKWIGLIPFKSFYPFTFSAAGRLERECNFLTQPHSQIKTPKIYRVDWERKILEREYVEGVKLSDIDVLEAAEKLAKILASLHREGWCLGDPKPSNFIIGNGQIYIIDCEQAVKTQNETYRIWDLVSSFFLLRLYKPLEAFKGDWRLQMFHIFSDNYLKAGGSSKLLEQYYKMLRDFLK
ncbi:hypothetical protein DRO53_01940 [Candidatus Bathyarchaeota archaeon]|nr:MAG: hypothetical protein DRO53_01940 [Candidatus Bathyarchaeota archaeon]